MAKFNPHVILSAAISIDGKISTRVGDSKLSSKEDSVRLHKLRSKVDAILIGKNTLLQDNPLLTVRYTKGKNPIRIILDSKGTIPINSKIIKTSNEIPTIIVVSKKISKTNLLKLQKLPIEIIVAGKNSINLKLFYFDCKPVKSELLLILSPIPSSNSIPYFLQTTSSGHSLICLSPPFVKISGLIFSKLLQTEPS